MSDHTHFLLQAIDLLTTWSDSEESCEYLSYCHVLIIQSGLCAIKPIHLLSWSYLCSAAVQPEATIPLTVSLHSGVLKSFAAFLWLFSHPDMHLEQGWYDKKHQLVTHLSQYHKGKTSQAVHHGFPQHFRTVPNPIMCRFALLLYS